METNVNVYIPYLDNIPIASEIKQILTAVFSAADPINAIQKVVRLQNDEIRVGGHAIPIDQDGKVMVWGVGKAVQKMAIGLKSVMGQRITNGAIITKHSDGVLADQLLPEIITYESDHPIPSQRSIEATAKSLEKIGKLFNERDILISLISGGGSALAVMPRKGISLSDYQIMTKMLLECGATINEINCIRAQIDLIKGGGLCEICSPAKIISLILSDVVGDSLDMIASGPTVRSNYTKQEAKMVIQKYGLEASIPHSIRAFFEEGDDSPGKARAFFQKEERVIVNVLVGSNTIAAHAAKKAAEELGFYTQIVSTTLQGEASRVGTKLGAELKEKILHAHKKSCWIYGGETTVTLHGKGKGGRNQELVLSAAKELAGVEGGCLLSIATDGEDGPTDAAGAIADGMTVQRGLQKGLEIQEHLENNDAYTYFRKVDGLIFTGPTGTNVNDLVFLFAY